MLTFEQIKELIDLVWERGLQGVEIERSGFRLKIDGKAATATVQSTAGKAVMPQAVETDLEAAPADQATSVRAPAAEGAEAAEDDETAGLDSLHLLRSPIVGTFYTSPSPDAEPYVGIGDPVKRGQVLCIVEAMKLMNEIESDEDGVVEKVFPKNAQPVEYGEALFAIRPQ